MKYLIPFNEITAASFGPSAYGNTGSAGGFTGPVAFHAQNTISGAQPTSGPETPVVYDKDTQANPYPAQRVKNSLKNTMQGNSQSREKDDNARFGSSKRRMKKLKSQLKRRKSFTGKFSQQRGKIQKFKDFAKDVVGEPRQRIQ